MPTAVGCDAVMTDSAIAIGLGPRAGRGASAQPIAPEIVVNLQGDAPFQPRAALARGGRARCATGDADVATPVVRLDWDALDALRAHKHVAPFSGTTCVRAADGRALWFSKTILPAIRDEAALRGSGERSRRCGATSGSTPIACAALEAFEAARADRTRTAGGAGAACACSNSACASTRSRSRRRGSTSRGSTPRPTSRAPRR